MKTKFDKYKETDRKEVMPGSKKEILNVCKWV